MSSHAPPRRPLRFGVLCRADGIPGYLYAAIEQALRDGVAELVVCAADTGLGDSRDGAGAPSGAADSRLWRLHTRLFPLADVEGVRRVPLTAPVLAAVPRISLDAADTAAIDAERVARAGLTLAEYDLDFLLCVDGTRVVPDRMTPPRLGFWSVQLSPSSDGGARQPGFWEIFRDDPTTDAVVVREAADGQPPSWLARCSVATEGRSQRRNVQRLLGATANLLRTACLAVQQGVWPDTAGAVAQSCGTPSSVQTMAFWMRLCRNWVRYKLENQRIDQWNVGLVRAPRHAFLDPSFVPEITWLPEASRRYALADPFLLSGTSADAGPRILAERVDWLTERGSLCGVDLEGNDRPIVLGGDAVHRSYPFCFRHDGDEYLIPECRAAGAIVLYRRDPASGRFARHAVLIDGVSAVDATVHHYDGRWWLFHGGRVHESGWALYVWYADSLLGPWQPHIGNPVKMDVRSSRPAGSLFEWNGALYRPAQDNRFSYGHGVSINRIDVLTPASFRETTVRAIAPPDPRYPDGFHTLSGDGDLTLIDSKRHVWPIALIARRFLTRRRAGRTPVPMDESLSADHL